MNTRNETGVEARLSALLEQHEQRLRQLEDHIAILNLLSSVGPMCDSGNAEGFAAIWSEDGVYRVGPRAFEGRAQIHDVVATGVHLDWMARGCAHFQSPPHISIDGDRATAVNYTTLIVHNAENELYEGRRLSANRWQLSRTPDGWRVDDRTIELLNGREVAQQLLAEGLRGPE